jgi:hypothetical protein
MVDTFHSMPVRARAPRKPVRKPLQFVNIGAGIKRAEEHGRAHTVEFLGQSSGKKNAYRATARRLRSRQVIASREFGTSVDAQAWLDGLRIPLPTLEG